jgi:hexosaminidase
MPTLLVGLLSLFILNFTLGDTVISVVPRPVSITPPNNPYELTDGMTIAAREAELEPVARFLAEALTKKTGLRFSVTKDVGNILLSRDSKLTRPSSYSLVSVKGDIGISGADAAGVFYGAQTLLQLIDGKTIQSCLISDEPRFQWRGLMLDVSRHFFNKDEVKRFLDLMAMHKLNVFHWHLVDDQGWRIEIKKYPQLIQKAAWRNEIGFGLDPKASTAYNAEGKYGGYFSQDDVREIIAYAKERYITIVPEIEMPGHATAALDVFPEFSCSGLKHDVNIQAGVHHGVFCAGKDETFTFLTDVLGEVMDLFPGQYIHVGGDEVPKDNWKKCEKCQARIKAENLKNEDELQSYFIKRIEKFVESKGKTLIGWDEILEGGLAEGAAVMSWRGATGGIAAANAGHDVVMSPTTHVYIDYLQERVGEPKGIGGFLPLERVYSLEPIPEDIAPDKRHHIIGAQANLWSEYIPNFRHVEWMAYPRACALAEVAWSPAEGKNYDDFLKRMQVHMKRLEAMGVNARPLPPAGLHDSIELIPGNPPTVKVLPRFEGGEIRYTLDGSIPTEESPKYVTPIEITNEVTPIRVRFIRPPNGPSYLTDATLLFKGDALFESWAGTSDEKNPPANAFDGKEETAYCLHGATPSGATMMEIRFLSPRALTHVRITTGSEKYPKEIVKNAVVEISADGNAWKQIAAFDNGTAEAQFPQQDAVSVRVRMTQGQFAWRTWVREIVVE